LRQETAGYSLESYEVHASLAQEPSASVTVGLPDGSRVRGESSGDGPVDSVFRAINQATGVDASLREFRVGAVTEGQDALGEVSVVIETAGESAAGQGVAPDIIEASARAYLRALSIAQRRGENAGGALGGGRKASAGRTRTP